jgi:hypothetical protein
VLPGILQTPHRFRTKRPLWKYSGFAIEAHRCGQSAPQPSSWRGAGQNRSRSIKWATKQEKFQPQEMCFFS